jgi:beta-lactamase class A
MMRFLPEHAIREACSAFPFTVAWYLRDHGSGERAHQNGDLPLNSGSVRKISILMAVLSAVHEGRLRLDQPVYTQEKYQGNDSGCFQHLSPGIRMTLQDALTAMIILSDNTCTGSIMDLISLEELNGYCRRIGMKSTLHRSVLPANLLHEEPDPADVNLTSVNDVGLLLDIMLAGMEDTASAGRLGCTPSLCRLALEIMSWQKIRNRLPALLPPGTRVAHKTGLDKNCAHDAGIIYHAGRPLFTLCVFVDRIPDNEIENIPGHAVAMHLIARISRICFDALTQIPAQNFQVAVINADFYPCRTS